MGAFNPNGAEEINPGCETAGTCTPAERNRNEGYLFWLAWIAHDTVGVFNVHDGTGPIRRVTLGGLNCQLLASEAEHAGTPEVLAEATATLFASIGACNK
jgi:hypothetical protein